MVRAISVVLLIALASGTSGSAQQSLPAVADREASIRIAALSQQLLADGSDRSTTELDQLTERVRNAVDVHVQSAFASTETSQQIQDRLRAILANHQPNPEHGDLPFARMANLSAGRALVVAYAIVRGAHNDISTIRGFVSDVNRFKLIATTGEDFDGYNMFKLELASPIAGEFWLLAWGQAQTFNGSRVRLRLYAFDGRGFRTVWEPDDLFSATVRATGQGFAIDHEVREPPFTVHDEYRLTFNGPIKVN
jgi:hypothetical protein